MNTDMLKNDLRDMGQKTKETVGEAKDTAKAPKGAR